MAENGETLTAPLIHNQNAILHFIRSVIVSRPASVDPFFVLDIAAVAAMAERWTRNLPAVRPFYAVKCNPDLSLLRELAAYGFGFDCASRSEIEAVLSLDVSPDRIIYANPCKEATHIIYAAGAGVNLTTYDSVFEVEKIQKHHPNCELLIRIKPPDEGDAEFPLAKKFGALPEEVEPLLRAAQAAQLRVIGVAFHIGCGAKRGDAYKAAIKAARQVFDTAARIGMPKLSLLNLGGGYSAKGRLFESVAECITTGLTEFFSDEPEVTVIAEPGWYFAGPVFTLAVNVIGKRQRGNRREYWMNDGIYGSVKLYDEKIVPAPFACASNPENPTCHGEKTYESTLFGPTCDAADTVLTDHRLPELQVNDWLVFPRTGGYTKSVACNFNGFNVNSILTYVTDSTQAKTN
ncbi:ornithine decarboxylase-like [Andrographis paniculata]|uniref:ornithine decarboxylase-like n=1 Tax=Andrographis paniculata TaxID=175694 RepID=UPI0021E92072|nr:ornithine decarboxylase-like [Andrographis paniculata]